MRLLWQRWKMCWRFIIDRMTFWPELEAGNILWEDIYGDLIHPNDLGHEYVAKFVTNLLEMVYQDLP